MIVKLNEFQESCRKILDSVDSNVLSVVSESLELESIGNTLLMNVTNKEYYVTVKTKLDVNSEEHLHTVVEASLFLNLISKITTNEVELYTEKENLVIKGNGTYKLPCIYENDKLVELPKITINNVTEEQTIDNNVLQDILKYNAKELLKSGLKRGTQKLFYLDNNGCITKTLGACVTNFTLNTTSKLLLPEKLIKLFKLFKSDKVEFKLGYDECNKVLQQKVYFSDDEVSITAILLKDDNLLSSFPAEAIRKRAEDNYKYSVVVNKKDFLESINRLSVFTKKDSYIVLSYIDFDNEKLTIFDTFKSNNESIKYVNSITDLDEGYEAIFDATDLKLTLESCDEDFITIKFGNHKAVVIERNNVKNIIPECNKI